MNDWHSVLGLPLWALLFVIPTLLAATSLIFRSTAQRILPPIWRILDRLYVASGVIAATFMCTILLIIVAQMFSRWTGSTFEGSTEFAGYAMAATSFFALAHALNHGAHIRVSILLNINDFTRFWVDAGATLIAAITATYFARYAIKTNFLSDMLNDRTQGQDQVPEWLLGLFSMMSSSPANWGDIWNSVGSEWVYTPVWLPQLPMSVGTVLLAIALWDNLVRLLVNGETSIVGEVLE
jgi:TRAP-type C4-dicarboxylate transport system permease small subunit